MPESKPRRWLVPLLAGLTAGLLGGLWLGLSRLAAAEGIPAGVKIGAILLASALCLVLALSWFWPILNQRRRGKRTGAGGIMVLVYLLPFLALAVPLRLAGLFLPSATVGEVRFAWLQPGPPWLLLIQGGLLAAALVPSGLAEIKNALSRPIGWPGVLLVGSALWLNGAFTFGLLSRAAGIEFQPALPAEPGLRVAAAASALLILPMGEELFFRRILPARLHALLPGATGPLPVWLLSAALFATLQARPLLWIPAFLFSLGLSALAEHTGRLRECVLAHSLYNLLALCLNWTTIL